MAARDKGDYRAALQHAQKAVVLAPKMIKAHFALGRTADEMCFSRAEPGANDQICGLAIQEYKKTLELDASHGEAMKNLAYVLYQFYRWDEAESYYRMALALHPDDPELLGAVAAMGYRRIVPDVMNTRARLKLGRKRRLIYSSACRELRDKNQARIDEGIALLMRALAIRNNNSELKEYLSVLFFLRAEIQCGNRPAYQADMKTSRAWNRAAEETKKDVPQDILSKLPVAPPPAPDGR